MIAKNKQQHWLMHHKINKLVFIVCCLIIICTLVTAYKAFMSSRKVIIKNIYTTNLRLAQSFIHIANQKNQHQSPSAVLSRIENTWYATKKTSDNDYLYVVNSAGVLLLHSQDPSQRGTYVGNTILHPDDPVSLQTLVKNKKPWVGSSISSTGEEDITAFSYLPAIDSMVSIHTPLSSINQQIIQTTLPWLVGLIFIGGMLFPLSLWLLNIAYRKGRDQLNTANISLNKEVHERRQAESALKQHQNELENIINERTHELIQARDAAISATHIKSEFLTNMSHELRTPLNSIIGFTDILRTGQAGMINKEQNRQITMVNDSARYLLGLINGILDLSKIESGKIDIEKSSFQIHDFMREVSDLFRPQINAKSLSINLSLKDMDKLFIYTDRCKLEQIIINLIGNAIKFTAKGTITVSCQRAGTGVVIQIKDTGIGIPEENQEIIFRSFQQGDATTSRKYGGTGLGLAISRQYANMLGGDLAVDSRPGYGSTFFIILPQCIDQSLAQAQAM